MGKFSLKMYSIGFIVPFYDGSNQEGLEELSKNLRDRYLEWFDVLKIELEQRVYPDQNPVILFTMVVRVDHSLVRDDQLESDWESMKVGIKEDLNKFFDLRKLHYEIIE